MTKGRLSREELIELVRKISNCEGSEEEVDAWIDLFSDNVPHPEAAGLIFWSDRYGLGDDPSNEEIVDAALSYKPIVLPPPRQSES